MTMQSVVQLLKENEKGLLQERRGVDRKPFVHPVTIASGRNHREIHKAFSRDISPTGIGLVSQVEWAEQTCVTLQIHTVRGKRIDLKARARWTRRYGDGWFLTGWNFLVEG